MLWNSVGDIMYTLYHNSLYTRVMLKSGTNVNEELGRHKNKNDRHCNVCGAECESVVYVLWECPAYDSIRNIFMV